MDEDWQEMHELHELHELHEMREIDNESIIQEQLLNEPERMNNLNSENDQIVPKTTNYELYSNKGVQESEKFRLSDIFENTELRSKGDEIYQKGNNYQLSTEKERMLGSIYDRVYQNSYKNLNNFELEKNNGLNSISIFEEFEAERVPSQFRREHCPKGADNSNDPPLDLLSQKDEAGLMINKFAETLEKFIQLSNKKNEEILIEQKRFYEFFNKLVNDQRSGWEERSNVIESPDLKQYQHINEELVSSINQNSESRNAMLEPDFRNLYQTKLNELELKGRELEKRIRALSDSNKSLKLERDRFELDKTNFLQLHNQLESDLKSRERAITNREKHLNYTELKHKEHDLMFEERQLQHNSKLSGEWETINQEKTKLKEHKDRLTEEMENKQKILDTEWKKVNKEKRALEHISDQKKRELNQRFKSMELELNKLDKKRNELISENKIFENELVQKRDELELQEQKIIEQHKEMEFKNIRVDEKKNGLELKVEIENKIRKELMTKMKTDKNRVDVIEKKFNKWEKELNKREKDLEKRIEQLNRYTESKKKENAESHSTNSKNGNKTTTNKKKENQKHIVDYKDGIELDKDNVKITKMVLNKRVNRKTKE